MYSSDNDSEREAQWILKFYVDMYSIYNIIF